MDYDIINLIIENKTLPLYGWIHPCNLCNIITMRDKYYYQPKIYIEKQNMYLCWICDKCIKKYKIKFNENHFITIRNLKLDKYIYYFYKKKISN